MARKGPKVYELAEEFGVQPQAVLDAAAVLGIHAQNRIARLTLEAAARVRTHLRGSGAASGAPAETAAAPLVPK
jgi:hypothetical protein